jgi:predicted site-specific integrase-resolvase
MRQKKKTIPDELTEKYYTEEEAAQLLGIGVMSLRTYCTSGRKHPPFKKVGRTRWFPKDEFWKWFDKANPTVRAS